MSKIHYPPFHSNFKLNEIRRNFINHLRNGDKCRNKTNKNDTTERDNEPTKGLNLT